MRELAKPRQARASEARARGAAALADLYGSTDAARAGGALMLFPLGHVVATPGALAALAAAGHAPAAFLARHAAGDWGDLDAADRAENALSLRRGFRLFSAYAYDPADPAAKVWVITEADRSSTTLLLPSEY